MTDANDSFIDEVSEAVRRDRLARWFRRWGWTVVMALVLIVAAAAWIEWRQAQTRAAAELRGEAVLASLEIPDDAERLGALQELPRDGESGVVPALLLAAEQEAAGDPAAAGATLAAVAGDGTVPELWRDLAAFKAQLALGDAADPLALEALSAPGEPFRLLALELWASVDIAAGRRAEAVARLTDIVEDAETTPAQDQRVQALLTALADEPAPGPILEAAPAPAPLDAGPAVDPDAEPGPAPAAEAPSE